MKTYKYHYVYRITNIVTNMYYYGDRSCNCQPKEDIGINYFSSSSLKLFIKDQKNNPQDYKYKVIRIFETCRTDAKQLEVDLHKRFDVMNHPKFINRANQLSAYTDTTGRLVSNTTRNKLSKLKLGIPLSDEHKHSISNTLSLKFDKNTHNSSKCIKIFNNDGVMMFETFGNFKKVCEDNGLPLYALLSSYRNNSTPIYNNLGDQLTKIKNLGYSNYIGWYATRLE